MALNYTITHNGKTWNSSTSVSSISISNGSTTASMSSAGTRTLNCAGKLTPNNIVIGAKTLNCAGKIMAGNVVITATNAGYTYNVWYGSRSTAYGGERLGRPFTNLSIDSSGCSVSGPMGSNVAPSYEYQVAYACDSNRIYAKCIAMNLTGSLLWYGSQYTLSYTGTCTYSSRQTLKEWDSTNNCVPYSLV